MDYALGFLFQNNPMGFPDWYFELLGGAASPNYEAIIRMQEKMYQASKVIFIIALVAAIGLFAVQTAVGVKVSPRELALSLIMTIFVMLSYNTIFSTVIETSVALGDQISTREDREDWAVTLRKRADDRTGGRTGWSAFGGYLSMVTTMAVGAVPQAIGALMVGCAGAVFLISMGVVWSLWIVLVMTLYAFGPLLVALGVVPRWGTKILANWFNALICLAFWNVYNAMCTWLFMTSASLFITSFGMDDTGAPDPGFFSGGRLLTTGAMCVVYTIMLIAGPFLINALMPLSSFLGIAGFGIEKGAKTFAGAMSGGATGIGGGLGFGGGSGGGSTGGGGGATGATGNYRTPSVPPGQ